MRTLVVEHQADAGAGLFGAPLALRGSVSRWRPAEEPPPDLGSVDALLVLGGGMHPDQDHEHRWLAGERALLSEALALGLPTLAVCLGAELLCQAAGGAIARADSPEIGWYEVELTGAGAQDAVLGGLPPRFAAFEWHSYVLDPPAGAEILAVNPCGVQAVRFGETAWAIQFHAEVTEAIALGWIEDYAADPDAVAMGLDDQALTAQTGTLIGPWNQLGRMLITRWAGQAESVRPAR